MENTLKRQTELDYAKTLAIFFMVIIHVFEELSSFGIEERLPTGFGEKFIQFGAGPYAAPLFIFAMGVGAVFSRNQDPMKTFKRGVKLLLVGICLNLARDVVPRLLVWLISGEAPEWEDMRYQIFNIDVLHFSGLAFMLTALFRKLKVPVMVIVPIAVVMQAVGNELSVVFQPGGFWELVCSYFFYTGDLSCFPLLTWYLSMAIGMAAGLLIQRFSEDLDGFYRRIFWGSLSMLMGFLCACYINGIDYRIFYALFDNCLYRQTFFNFLYNTSVIALLLAAIHMLTKKVTKGYSFFGFCGTNLTTIYVAQWMIIGWLTSFQDYHGIVPGFAGSIGLGILIALVSIGITKLLPPIKW